MDNPVAWMVTYGGLTNIVYTQPTYVVDTHYQPLYAAPPQRTWVGLTDEDREECLAKHEKFGWWSVIDAIEEKLWEKNGG